MSRHESLDRAGSRHGTRRRRQQPCIAWLALFAAALVGCSPISFARRARDAERALGLAEAAHADEHARYELTLARLQLAKAREQSGGAHYASALDLLARAEQNAKRAQLLARARAGSGGSR